MTTAPLTTTVTIVHPQGVHLRVGKDLAFVANRFHADTTARNITLSTPPVDLKSILQIMRLQARTGHIVQLSADGPDAEDAIAALRNVLECPEQSDAI
jgi:phosphotransferase system HPr (HPr) family protein